MPYGQLFAAIHAPTGENADLLLRELAAGMTVKGFRVAGFVQRDTRRDPNCCGRLEIENLQSGEIHVISQALGTGAKGCKLNPQALADIANALLEQLDARIDLLVLNRFGKGESEGHGFRQLIEVAIARGIPTIVSVKDEYLKSWSEFAGDIGVLLPMNYVHISSWYMNTQPLAEEIEEILARDLP